jgi:hypothetical protein
MTTATATNDEQYGPQQQNWGELLFIIIEKYVKTFKYSKMTGKFINYCNIL